MTDARCRFAEPDPGPDAEPESDELGWRAPTARGTRW
jgi:hypothetical protein